YGDLSVCFKITNPAVLYNSNPDLYESFHGIFLNIIKIVGPNHVIQKIDAFSSKIYNQENGIDYLSKKYDEHFKGREYKDLETYLNITHITKGKYNKASYNDFLVNIKKVEQQLEDSNLKPSILKTPQLNNLKYRTIMA